MASPAQIANDLDAVATVLDGRTANAHIVSIKRGAKAVRALHEQRVRDALFTLALAQAVAEDVDELAETEALWRPNGEWDIENIEIEGRLLQRARLLIEAKKALGPELEISPLAADVLAQVRLRGLAA